MSKRKLSELITTIGTTIRKIPKHNDITHIIPQQSNTSSHSIISSHPNISNRKKPKLNDTPEIKDNTSKHNHHNHHNHNHNKTPRYTPYKIPVPLRKEQVPKRIRELVWNTYNGDKYSSKCYVGWCHNNINVFNFQVGHDIPESKGGTLEISNLRPICGNCNLSMGNKYTITEWSDLVQPATLPKPKLNTNLEKQSSEQSIEQSQDQHEDQPNKQPSNKLPISHDLEKTMKKLLKKTIIELENTQQQLPDTIPDNTNTPIQGPIQGPTPVKYKLIAALGMVIMVLNLFV